MEINQIFRIRLGYKIPIEVEFYILWQSLLGLAEYFFQPHGVLPTKYLTIENDENYKEKVIQSIS